MSFPVIWFNNAFIMNKTYSQPRLVSILESKNISSVPFMVTRYVLNLQGFYGCSDQFSIYKHDDCGQGVLHVCLSTYIIFYTYKYMTF